MAFAYGEMVRRGDLTYRMGGIFLYLTGYDGDGETVTVPAEVDGCQVAVEETVFDGCEKLRQLIFEREVFLSSPRFGIRDNWPFRNCPALESVTLPDHMGYFESGLPGAEGCPSLKSLEVRPGHPHYLSKNGFFYRRRDEGGLVLLRCLSDKETLTVPGRVGGSRVRAVDLGAFTGCEKLKHLVIGEGITELLGDICFGAETIRLPNSYQEPWPGWFVTPRGENFRRFLVKPDHPVFTEEDGSLYDRLGETLIFAPMDTEVCRVREGVRKISPYAFYCHRALKAVFLPESLREIGREAFCGCQRLYYLSLPEGFDPAAVGDHAFSMNFSLHALFRGEQLLPVPVHSETEAKERAFLAETFRVPAAEELTEMREEIARMGFEEYDRLCYKEPEPVLAAHTEGAVPEERPVQDDLPDEWDLPDPKEQMQLARQEIEEMSEEERDELTELCIGLAGLIGL